MSSELQLDWLAECAALPFARMPGSDTRYLSNESSLGAVANIYKASLRLNLSPSSYKASNYTYMPP